MVTQPCHPDPINQPPDYEAPLVTLTPPGVEVIDAQTFKYVPHLQNLHRSEVGFLPTVALRQYEARRQLWLARHNGEPCGYLAWGSFRGPRPKRDPFTIKIIQACIDYDAQRSAHGQRLVRHLERLGTMAGIDTLSLWCADDLDANHFWQAMGFNADGTRVGGSAFIEHRTHTHWTKTLPVPLLAPIRFSPIDLPWSPTGPRSRR